MRRIFLAKPEISHQDDIFNGCKLQLATFFCPISSWWYWWQRTLDWHENQRNGANCQRKWFWFWWWLWLCSWFQIYHDYCMVTMTAKIMNILVQMMILVWRYLTNDYYDDDYDVPAAARRFPSKIEAVFRAGLKSNKSFSGKLLINMIFSCGWLCLSIVVEVRYCYNYDMPILIRIPDDSQCEIRNRKKTMITSIFLKMRDENDTGNISKDLSNWSWFCGLFGLHWVLLLCTF